MDKEQQDKKRYDLMEELKSYFFIILMNVLHIINHLYFKVLSLNKKILLSEIRKGESLEYASKRLKDDEEVVLTAVQMDSFNLEFASDRLKDDIHVVMAAVSQNGAALIYASARLKDDKEFFLSLVNINGAFIYYASDRLKDDKEAILAAVKNNYWALLYASDRLKGDIPFCIECANINSDCALFFESEAKDLFQAHQNDVDKVEKVYIQQQAEKAKQQEEREQKQANEALLSKLSTGEIVVSTNKLFKRKLFNV